ncbi:hypothetical protein BDY19DRAFT_904008 [Irpex rosettiformis]|uniref:Uncharacterized protein n=1 Tax=Irpex rosettiformis TaxID=378272 RepID=A0ACB8UD68_9APHY|nr:hypothetical protein BDY19DRAFT_904008 [Irpex rosettiformis]
MYVDKFFLDDECLWLRTGRRCVTYNGTKSLKLCIRSRVPTNIYLLEGTLSSSPAQSKLENLVSIPIYNNVTRDPVEAFFEFTGCISTVLDAAGWGHAYCGDQLSSGKGRKGKDEIRESTLRKIQVHIYKSSGISDLAPRDRTRQDVFIITCNPTHNSRIHNKWNHRNNEERKVGPAGGERDNGDEREKATTKTGTQMQGPRIKSP